MPFPYTFPISFDDDGSLTLRTLKQLLPPGSLWNLEPDSWLSKVLTALADELERVLQRGSDLIEESDPRTATETIEQWEAMLGLPDDVITTISASLSERRLAVTQKLIRGGGQTAVFYTLLSAACGYTVTVTDDFGPYVMRAGFRCGDRCYSVRWAFVWQLNVSPPAGAALTHAELEAVINRAKPAHTEVIFNYL